MHLASLIEWILTTIDGFERDDVDPLNTGVRQSSRARFTAALGRPGGFFGSAMPKKRQQSFDLQTQEPGGRPNLSQISAGMSLYWLGRLGLAAQASACLPKQGGPAGIPTCPSTSRAITTEYNGRGREGISMDNPWISLNIPGYP